MVEQVGWLVWNRVNGRVYPTKFSLQGYPSFPESLKQQQEQEVQKTAIYGEDWKLSLAELAEKYLVKEPADAPK